MDSEEDILENSLVVVGVEVEELAGPEGVLERVLVRGSGSTPGQGVRLGPMEEVQDKNLV